MNKNLIKCCVVALVITLFVVAVFLFSKAIMKKENKSEESNGKIVLVDEHEHDEINDKAPYTLEEIYDLVSNPKKYKEVFESDNDALGYELLHFYDYFSKNTPFMYAKKVKIDGKCEDKQITEVVEVGFMNYEQYEQEVAYFLEQENSLREVRRGNGKRSDGRVPGAGYDFYSKHLIYDHAQYVNRDDCKNRYEPYEWEK